MAKKKFSFKQISIVVVILVVIAVLIWLILSPPQIFACSRDAKRAADISAISAAIGLYLADNQNFNSLKDLNYVSNTNQPNSQSINGQGWLPLDFSKITSGEPFAVLPVDPLNNDYYRYIVKINPEKKTYEINCLYEAKNNQGKMLKDGGNNPNVYEVGTDLALLQ